MKKVLIVNVKSRVTDGTMTDKTTFLEFEPTELNKYLSDGWVITSQEIVTNQTTNTFSIVFHLTK